MASIDFTDKSWKNKGIGKDILDIIKESGSNICHKCQKVKRQVDMGRSYCRQCTSAANKEWREKNRDHNKKRLAKWESENKESRKIRQRKSELTESQRERKNRKMREWRKNNPEKAARHCNNKRAKRRSAEGKFTNDEWKAVVDHFSGRCVYCGEKGKMTVEHVVPLSRGGTNYIENIVPACLGCNASKGKKTVEEFLSR